jgi:hypothetical protein
MGAWALGSMGENLSLGHTDKQCAVSDSINMLSLRVLSKAAGVELPILDLGFWINEPFR